MLLCKSFQILSPEYFEMISYSLTVTCLCCQKTQVMADEAWEKVRVTGTLQQGQQR